MTALRRLLALFRRRERNGGWSELQQRRVEVGMRAANQGSALW